MAKFLTELPNPWYIRPGEIWQLSVYSRFTFIIQGVVKIYNTAGVLVATDYLAAVTVNRNRVTAVLDAENLSVAIASIGKIVFYLEITDPSGQVNNGVRCTEMRTFLINREPVNAESCTVAWINKLGAQDLYTFTLRQTRNKSVQKTRSESELGMPFDIKDRGIKTIAVNGQTGGTMSTGYMNKATRLWLADLFDSANVWIYRAGQRIPIEVTIENLDFDDNEDLLAWQIEFIYANQIRAIND
jgi:hypothetical protein